jgi:MFS family permease
MKKYLFILISAILADVVCNNSIVQVFEIQSHFNSLTLIFTMLGLQMIAAPIQAGFSDFYRRKKSLIVALSVSFISLFLLIYSKSSSSVASIFLLLSLVINACLGNTIPIAWSALADIQHKKLRFYLAITTTAYAIGYIALALFGKTGNLSENAWLWQDIILPLCLIGLSILFIWKYYDDLRDKKLKKENPHFAELARTEFGSLSKELQSRSTLFGLLAYFCWACSQYSVLLMLLESQKYNITVVIMMIGYIVGVSILGFNHRIRDEKIIRLAFLITIISIILFFSGNIWSHDSEILFSISGFLYTWGNAFLTPSLFSLFSKERGVHEQGKGFGLIVSADSAGFLIGVILVQVFNNYKIDSEYMILFSSIIFLISWLPYSIYEKTRKNSARFNTENS